MVRSGVDSLAQLFGVLYLVLGAECSRGVQDGRVLFDAVLFPRGLGIPRVVPGAVEKAWAVSPVGRALPVATAVQNKLGVPLTTSSSYCSLCHMECKQGLSRRANTASTTTSPGRAPRPCPRRHANKSSRNREESE